MILLSNSCVPCNPTCQTCYGDASDQCLTCTLPKLLAGSACVTKCPNGMFHSQVTHTCESCHATCESCSGPTDSDCHSCKGMFCYPGLQFNLHCLLMQYLPTFPRVSRYKFDSKFPLRKTSKRLVTQESTTDSTQ